MVDALSDGAEPVASSRHSVVLAPPPDPAPLARALERLRRGEYALGRLHERQRRRADVGGPRRLAADDARAFGRARLAAIGPATAAALGKHGLRADVTAEEFRGEGLAEAMLAAMKDGPPQARAARAGRAGAGGPARRAACGGLEVDVVAAYETQAASSRGRSRRLVARACRPARSTP